MLMLLLLLLVQLLLMMMILLVFILLDDGFAPCWAVESGVPFAKHINVSRAVFRAQNRCKKYF